MLWQVIEAPFRYTCDGFLIPPTAIFQGESKLVLGRERHETATGGVEVNVRAGDVVVVPAGVSHRSLSADGDYRYIGVYPEVGICGSLVGLVQLLIKVTDYRSPQNGEIIGARGKKIWRN